jgi:hypothetical protein
MPVLCLHTCCLTLGQRKYLVRNSCLFFLGAQASRLLGSGQNGRAPRIQAPRAQWHQHYARVLSTRSMLHIDVTSCPRIGHSAQDIQ